MIQVTMEVKQWWEEDVLVKGMAGDRHPLLRGGCGPRLRGVGERGRGQAPLLRGSRGPCLRGVGERGRGQAPLLRGGGGPRLRGVGERGRGQAPLLRGGGGPRLRGVGERGRGQGHGPRRWQQQHRVSNEIRAIVVDHGMTMTEAATMIQPNLRKSTVASIIRTFRNENR